MIGEEKEDVVTEKSEITTLSPGQMSRGLLWN
jgi:hypothetical protein